MQLIAEAYDLMKNGLGMTCDEMAASFAEWNKGELDSFLIEITKDILGLESMHAYVRRPPAPNWPLLDFFFFFSLSCFFFFLSISSLLLLVGCSLQGHGRPAAGGEDQGHRRPEGNGQVDGHQRAGPGHAFDPHWRGRVCALPQLAAGFAPAHKAKKKKKRKKRIVNFHSSSASSSSQL
jgi:hypothetical protein